MTQARRIILTGRVQGVGFRPFVYNLAARLGINGTVRNGSGKVYIHAEGAPSGLDDFEHALVSAAPPLARPRLERSEDAGFSAFERFSILPSEASTEAEIHVPPDLFTCDDCLQELTGEQERRFGYPFINCTQCGPRYTIITAMPYDRPNTTMAGFPLCDDCRKEYESPSDRRFHAQPLACPACGPSLEFVDADAESPAVGAAVGAASAAKPLSKNKESRRATAFHKRIFASGKTALAPSPALKPLLRATQAIDAARTIAIKGVGGYHLVCDAANDRAVQGLRERKRRPHKPLAVMFPWAGEDGLDLARQYLELDEVTAAAITDPARPIVLARKKPGAALSSLLAPGLDELGVFLPYSPLHYELLNALGRPIVATSGNISGEPVITGNADAGKRLARVADHFLHHDRPIARPADDSVIRPMAGVPRVIRLGRGIAPLERELPGALKRPLLATGGHMKNTVALAWGSRVVISPHIGDLDSPRSNDIFNQIINDIKELYNVNTQSVACDLHPGYASTRWAEQQGQPLIRVQHHAAHASSLAGEHADIENWLVFTWDGVGYGDDGTLWGGEALCGRPGHWQRAASFRTFKLIGGDKAGREPWRAAAALLWGVGAASATISFDLEKAIAAKAAPTINIQLAHQAWQQNINTFETSAVGRLFDAAAALVLGRSMASFEGQGPMELEHAAISGCEAVRLPLEADKNGLLRSDWAPLLSTLCNQDLPEGERAGIFHETLAQALLDQALALRESHPFDAIGLSGGVFQNRFLTERVADKLGQHGIDVRLHCAIPANDGGLCFGQVIEALARQ